MSALLGRASRRYLARHPALTLLSVLGVALGVAVVVAIDLTNASAERAFTLSADAVAGHATHVLNGGPGGVPESLYPMLKRDLSIENAAPVLEGHARASAHPAEVFTLLGVDALAELPFRPYLSGGRQGDLGRLWTEPGAALVSSSLAQRLGVKRGDRFPIEIEGVGHVLEVVGLLDAADANSRSALDSLAVLDIATAQELMGRQGTLSRIDLLLPEGDAGRLQAESIRLRLPPGIELQAAGSRTGALAQMIRAFQTNLTALSLLALFVGLFLIYNAATFSVVQRRALFGRLRALGVTRAELFRRVLSESLLLASAGTAAGLLGGTVLARGLLTLVTRTVNDLYFVVSVRDVALAPLPLLKGVLLGMAGTVVAALLPAYDAAQAPVAFTLQRSNSEERIRRRAPRIALGGLTLAIGGALLLKASERALPPAYLGLFAILLGSALVIPVLLAGISRPMAPLLGVVAGLIGRMAARSVAAHLSRTGVAVAALSVAMATTVGIGVMVSSFRETVVAWLDTSLQSDVYVSPPSDVFRRGNATLLPALVQRLTTLPGVADFNSVRVVPVQTDRGDVDLIAPRFSAGIRPPYRFLSLSTDEAWDALAAPDAIAVSEPFAFHRQVAIGDGLTLHTDEGPRRFRIIGIFQDYGSDQGTLLLSRSTYDAHFRDRAVSGVSLQAASGTGVDDLVDRARLAAAGVQTVAVRSNRSLRQTSLEIFDRTFTITHVLQLLSLCVALVGVISALLALQLERSRELAVLRALGLTPGQVWGLATLQTGILGLLAGIFSVPLGLLLASILVRVINRRSFGWTLALSVPPGVLIQAVGFSVVAALVAGIYPAWRMARTAPTDALRDE